MKKISMMNSLFFLGSMLFFIVATDAYAGAQRDDAPEAAEERAHDHRSPHTIWDNPDELFEEGGQRLFDEMERVQQSMRQLIDQRFGLAEPPWYVPNTEGEFNPLTDVQEQADAYVIELDLPGMNREQLDVSVVDGVMVISGERDTRAIEQQEDERGGAVYYRQERNFGTFRRSFPLPVKVKQEEIQAQYENGVLRIVIPKHKAAPKTQPQKIIIS